MGRARAESVARRKLFSHKSLILLCLRLFQWKPNTHRSSRTNKKIYISLYSRMCLASSLRAAADVFGQKKKWGERLRQREEKLFCMMKNKTRFIILCTRPPDRPTDRPSRVHCVHKRRNERRRTPSPLYIFYFSWRAFIYFEYLAPNFICFLFYICACI